MADAMEAEMCEEKLSDLTKEKLLEMVIRLRNENQVLQKTISKFQSPSGTRAPEKTADESPASRQTKTSKSNAKTSKEAKTKRKPFDFSRYNTRRIALKIAYLGWDMHGFASQENIDTTIEAYLFDALTKACLVEGREGSNYSRCGRTDKGVSAFGQVVSLCVRTNLTEGTGVIKKDGVLKEKKDSNTSEIPYVVILNKLLPDEIRVLAWTPVCEDFDARFSCSYRRYKYYFPMGDLNIELMNNAAKKLEGEHDFRNFCKMDVANGVVQFKRAITSFQVLKVSDCDTDEFSADSDTAIFKSSLGYEMCEAEICGSAFLWHQVRCMMSVLLMVGQGLEKPEVIDWLLDVQACSRRPQYNMASENPLVLYDCAYEDLPWLYENQVLESITKHLQQLWRSYQTRATLVRELITTLDEAVLPGVEEETWCSAKPLMKYQANSIVPGLVAKSHKLLAKRAVCESLEEKLENVNVKRRKLGKEPIAMDPE